MSNYNWCHGPECHTFPFVNRIRGSGRDKVLRTIKIKVNPNDYHNIHNYFCNTRCLYDYLNKHTQAIANIAPRREALETPIKVEKEKYESYRYEWDGKRVPYQATKTTINRVDNDNG